MGNEFFLIDRQMAYLKETLIERKRELSGETDIFSKAYIDRIERYLQLISSSANAQYDEITHTTEIYIGYKELSGLLKLLIDISMEGKK